MKKLISWNVNGLRACVGKGFLDIFKELDADIFCIQESKLQGGQIDLELDGYYQYWSYAEKKGYSGTCLLYTSTPARGSITARRTRPTATARTDTIVGSRRAIIESMASEDFCS